MTCTREETVSAVPAAGDQDDSGVVHITAAWFARLRIRLGKLVPRALCGVVLENAVYYPETPAGLPDCPRCAYLSWARSR